MSHPADRLSPETAGSGGPTDARRLGRRRLVALVAFAALLLVQGAWSFGTKPEPYPTVRMPGFGNAATADGLFLKRTLDVVVRYDDGTQSQVRPGELMAGVRGTSARPTLEQVFWPDVGGERTAENEVVRGWLVEHAHAVAAAHAVPGDHAVPVELVLHRCEVGIDIRTAVPVDDGVCEVERLGL